MRNIVKNTLIKLSFILLVVGAFQACKKGKDEVDHDRNSCSYQGKTSKITTADFREGNGDGAWIYLTGEDFTDFVQIRFAKLNNYQIPTAPLPIATFRRATTHLKISVVDR